MKILLVNKYFYLKGGSEAVFFDTARLLKDKGHDMIYFSMDHPLNRTCSQSEYFVSRVDYNETKKLSQKFKASKNLIYSFEAKKKFEALIEKERPDIIHLHNIYHQISPSILSVCRKYKLPTVMSLHDYKLVCPIYTLFTDGHLCEKCLNKKYYWCWFKKCTRGSYIQSFLNATEMYIHHKLLNIYDQVDVFVSPSLFLMKKLREAGFRGKIVLIPHFVWVNDFVPSSTCEENVILYFGRLSAEKGIFTLLEALKGQKVRCHIIGSGPLKHELENKIHSCGINNVTLSVHKPWENMMDMLRRALFVILPSEWYENSPRVIYEAFAMGKPVIGSRTGGIPELVKDHQTGLTFTPGDASDLREKISQLWQNQEWVIKMGRNARNFVEDNFGPESYYEKLMELYTHMKERHHETR